MNKAVSDCLQQLSTIGLQLPLRDWSCDLFVYLDESGDLGFDFSKQKTSPYFVITILVCHQKVVVDGISTAVKRTLKNKLNHKKQNKRVVTELKGAETTFAVKEYFSRNLPDEGWDIYSVTLNKGRVEAHLQTKDGKKKLYNYLARFILEKIPFADDLPWVNLIVDRCKNNEEIKDFNSYVENQLNALLPLNCKLTIDHLASHENAGLQAVDLFCWGIARKDAYSEMDWFALYCDHVRFTTIYLA